LRLRPEGAAEALDLRVEIASRVGRANGPRLSCERDQSLRRPVGRRKRL